LRASPRHHDRIDAADLPPTASGKRSSSSSTHPLCSECQEWERRLAGDGALVKRDVRERPDLARKYGIAVVPTVLAVAADGEVLERLVP
jgi:hypothetical protein